MNKLIILFISLLFTYTIMAQNEEELKTDLEKFSYSLGVNILQGLEKQGVTEIDVNAFTKGVKDYIEKKELVIPEEDILKTIQEYFKNLHAANIKENKTAGEKFLAENKKRKEVITTESGLQYEIIKEGTGNTPKADSKVEVHYHGTLIDGTVFDSSVERGKPIVLSVNKVIKGWTEALQLMKEGAKWKLYIPYLLAYGTTGSGNKIEPYSTLIFEVELLSIK